MSIFSRIAVTGIAAVSAIGLLSGCAPVQPAPEPTKTAIAKPTPTPTKDPNLYVGNSVVGLWGETDPKGPSLQFAANGNFNGADGCNRLAGEWKPLADGSVDLGNMIATLMYCEGVDTWLNYATRAKVDGDVLIIFSETSEIGRLAKAKQ